MFSFFCYRLHVSLFWCRIKFSCTLCRLHVFLPLLPIACFSTFGAAYMFSGSILVVFACFLLLGYTPTPFFNCSPFVIYRGYRRHSKEYKLHPKYNNLLCRSGKCNTKRLVSFGVDLMCWVGGRLMTSFGSSPNFVSATCVLFSGAKMWAYTRLPTGRMGRSLQNKPKLFVVVALPKSFLCIFMLWSKFILQVWQAAETARGRVWKQLGWM